MIQDFSVDRSLASVTLMKPLMFTNLIDTPCGLPRYRSPEKRTLAPVQLRNPG